MPLLHLSTNAVPADSFLQHLELVSALPAFVVGYISTRQGYSVATWSWCVPAAVLAYKMAVKMNAPHSLFAQPMSPFTYYFDIQRTMPTFANSFIGDPVRVVAQMFITAPFYAGVAYSVGAVAARYRIAEQLFTFPAATEDAVKNNGEAGGLAAAAGDEYTTTSERISGGSA